MVLIAEQYEFHTYLYWRVMFRPYHTYILGPWWLHSHAAGLARMQLYSPTVRCQSCDGKNGSDTNDHKWRKKYTLRNQIASTCLPNEESTESIIMTSHGHLCLVKRILLVWEHVSSPNISQALCKAARIVTGIKPSLLCQVHIPGQVPLFNLQSSRTFSKLSLWMDDLAFLFAKCWKLFLQPEWSREGRYVAGWWNSRFNNLNEDMSHYQSHYDMHTWCACTDVLHLTCPFCLSSSMCSMPSVSRILSGCNWIRSSGRWDSDAAHRWRELA